MWQLLTKNLGSLSEPKVRLRAASASDCGGLSCAGPRRQNGLGRALLKYVEDLVHDFVNRFHSSFLDKGPVGQLIKEHTLNYVP